MGPMTRLNNQPIFAHPGLDSRHGGIACSSPSAHAPLEMGNPPKTKTKQRVGSSLTAMTRLADQYNVRSQRTGDQKRCFAP